MKVYLATGTGYPWRGNYIFDAPDVEPEVWGFGPTPALTTAQEQGEEGKDGFYFLKGEAYRHAEAGSVLLLVTLRRWDERAAGVAEERLAVIFKNGNLEDIPQVLHRIRPETLSSLVDAKVRPTGVISVKSYTTGVRPDWIETGSQTYTTGWSDARSVAATETHSATTG